MIVSRPGSQAAAALRVRNSLATLVETGDAVIASRKWTTMSVADSPGRGGAATRGLIDAAAAGVDLMISGHTHNGQIAPFNLVVKRVFEQTVALFHHGQTQLYVSPGTGTWGPVMRLGSRGEVTLFEVQPLTSAH